MSKNRQQRRAMRSAGVPVPGIVATDPVAVGPTVAPRPIEFPGVERQGTPIFDALMTPKFAHAVVEADFMVGEPFEPWDIVERVPLPIEGMIEDLRAGMDPDVAWTIEESVGAQALLDRLRARVGEVDDDDDDGPAGDPAGVDAGGADAVAADDGPGPQLAAAG